MSVCPLALNAQPFTVEREWTVDGIPVLTAAVTLPRPAERASRTERRIDRFYQAQARAYLRYCERTLFPPAAEGYRQALAASAPLPCAAAALTYRVTCDEGGLWSLHTDTRERLGGRTELHRRGDTWDLAAGFPVPLSAFFAHRGAAKSALLRAAGEEIVRQETAGAAQYHPDWRRRLRRYYHRERFFLTPEGVCLFYPMYAIAPAAEGIPTFLLPFGQAGCRRPGLRDGGPAEASGPEPD